MIREIEIQQNNGLNKSKNPLHVSGVIVPVKDYRQRRLNIAQRIASNPANTFYFEADDDQMRYFGIRKGSIIVVDKSVQVSSGMLIVCCIGDEWLTRKLCVKGENTYLCINDGLEACINITDKDITVLGAVTWTCLPHIKQNVSASGLQ